MRKLEAIRSGEIYDIIEYEDCYRTDDLYYPKSEADKVIAEKDKEIAELKKEVLRQKRLRCYNLRMWCSSERFTHRGRTIPDEGRWWERHFYSVCRIWEKFKEANNA